MIYIRIYWNDSFGNNEKSFQKKFRVYRDDLQKLMQSISIEKVKDVLKNGPRELKESVQKSLEKTSEKNWYYKAAKSCE